MDEKAITNNDINAVFPVCPDCNAVLEKNSTTGKYECPNGCETIEYLD